MLHRRWLFIELGDVGPTMQRLTDDAKGEHPRWDSARGRGRTNGKALGDKQRRAVREVERKRNAEPELRLLASSLFQGRRGP